MFTHIVFFKLKDPTKENLIKAKTILMSMSGNIPMLKFLEVGIDEVRSERSYDIALFAKFDSKMEMEAYQEHPYHVEQVIKPLKALLHSSKTVDYEY